MAFSFGRLNSPPRNQTSNNTFNRQFASNQDQFSQKVLLQNRALAKKNSILMTKITDLETRISELIQHNIELRALNAKKEDEKHKWLEEKLNIIEQGVGQRFEEIFQMFSNIRSNEGLPVSNLKLANLIGNSPTDLSTDKAVSFDNAKSPKAQKASKSERRRKSARRQSIYIPPPDSPAINENAEIGLPATELKSVNKGRALEEQQQQEQNQYHSERPLQIPSNFESDENPFHDPVGQRKSSGNISHKTQEESPEEKISENSNDAAELSRANNLSPIRFSSPRLDETKKTKFFVYDDSNDNDTDKTYDLDEKVKRLAFESVRVMDVPDNDDYYHGANELEKNELSDEQKPLIQNANKVKHTKAKTKRSKSSDDEHMPEAADPVLSTRKSRTRGKAVSYAEPSLRVKMRRQSAKFVGAVEGEKLKDFVRSQSVLDSTSDTIEDIKPAETEYIKTIDLAEKKQFGKETTEELQHAEESTQEAIKQEEKRTEDVPKLVPLTLQDNANITKRRKPLSNLTANPNKVPKLTSKPIKKFELDDDSDLSVFDLVEETAVGIPSKTYKGTPDIKPKRRNSKRHSMIF